MKTNLHLAFPGTCREAFAFYEKTFDSKVCMTITYGEAPAGSPVPPGMNDKVMHTSMPLGGMTLMGCDASQECGSAIGGFQISIDSTDEAEVKRLFDALSAGGSVQMPPQKTFWAPLFGMCKDKFGVAWMVSVPGQPPSQS